MSLETDDAVSDIRAEAMKRLNALSAADPDDLAESRGYSWVIKFIDENYKPASDEED